MSKKTKSKEKEGQILTGHGLVAEILNCSVQHVSDVLNTRRPDNKGVFDELKQYAQFQKAYIKKRQIILGFNKK